MVLRFNTSEVFLSDNGTEFKNKAVDEYLEKEGIRHMTTPPYHAHANPVERANRTIKQMLCAYVEGTHNTWDRFIPEVVHALNNAKSSTTGLSPAMLNYGRQPIPPGTLRRRLDNSARNHETEDSVGAWSERL